jgi:hypothetical protein
MGFSPPYGKSCDIFGGNCREIEQSYRFIPDFGNFWRFLVPYRGLGVLRLSHYNNGLSGAATGDRPEMVSGWCRLFKGLL